MFYCSAWLQAQYKTAIKLYSNGTAHHCMNTNTRVHVHVWRKLTSLAIKTLVLYADERKKKKTKK